MISLKNGLLWQWDLGCLVSLTTQAGSTIQAIDFSSDMHPNAIPVDIKEIDGEFVAQVPNTLLQYPGLLYAHMSTIDELGKRAVEEAVFRVRPRKKPLDYVYTEEEIKIYEALEKKIDKALEETGYYVPEVDKDGNLGWNPSKEGLPQAPQGVNIKGPKGDKGDSSIVIDKRTGKTIVMNDSVDASFANLRVYGDSWQQKQASGKNLFNINNFVNQKDDETSKVWVENNGLVIKNDTGEGHGCFVWTVTLGRLCPELKAGDEVYLNMDIINPCGINEFYLYGSGRDWINGTSLVITQEDLDSNFNVYGLYGEITIYQNIVVSKEPIEYEPYTGGQSVPNREYQQPVISTGQKLLSEGHQLFDISQLTLTEASDVIYDGWITELGDNYVVVTTSSEHSGNGYCNTNKKLKEVCPNLVAGETYLLNANTESTDAWFYLGVVWEFGKAITITEDMLESNVVMYGYNARDHKQHGVCKISDIMIVKGTEEKAWEPYTGGVPQIVDVGVEVKVIDKNLFDVESASDANNWEYVDTNYFYCFPIRVGSGNTVTIKNHNVLGGGLESIYMCVTFEKKYDGNDIKHWLYHPSIPEYYNVTLTLTAQEDYLYLWCTTTGVIYGDFMQYVGNTLQVEYGTEATEFKAYSAQVLSIPYVLRKDDKIDCVRKKLIRNFKQRIFDGTEGWYQYYDVVALANWDNFETPGHPNSDLIGALCNIARESRNADGEIFDNTFATYNMDGSDWIVFNIEISVEDWKSYLAEQYANGTPVYVWYPLARGIEIDIDLEPLTLRTSYPSTTIRSNAELEVECAVDVQKFIQSVNRFKTLIDVTLDDASSGVNDIRIELPESFENCTEFNFYYEIPGVTNSRVYVFGYITDRNAIAYAKCIYYNSGEMIQGNTVKGIGTVRFINDNVYFAVCSEPTNHSGANSATNARTLFDFKDNANYKDFPPYLQFRVDGLTLPSGTRIVLEGR